MKIGAAQRKARVSGIAQARQFLIILFRQVGTHPLPPGVLEDRLQQIGLILGVSGETRSISEGSRPHVPQARAAQVAHQREYCGQIALFETIAFPVVSTYRLVDRLLEPRIPSEVHVRQQRTLPQRNAASGRSRLASCSRAGTASCRWLRVLTLHIRSTLASRSGTLSTSACATSVPASARARASRVCAAARSIPTTVPSGSVASRNQLLLPLPQPASSTRDPAVSVRLAMA